MSRDDVTDEMVEVVYAGLNEVLAFDAKTPEGRRGIVEEFLGPLNRHGVRLAVAPIERDSREGEAYEAGRLAGYEEGVNAGDIYPAGYGCPACDGTGFVSDELIERLRATGLPVPFSEVRPVPYSEGIKVVETPESRDVRDGLGE